jgi:NAD+ diphosphatase
MSTDDVRPFLGSEPFFGQGKEEGENVLMGVNVLEASRHRGTPIVFLGLQEHQTSSASALPSSDFTDPKSAVANLTGTPFFSIDVAGFEGSKVDEVLKNSSLARGGETLIFSEPRAAMGDLDAFHAALFAEARSMVDWIQRNKFCPACGSSTYPIWAGWKLSCSSLLPWADNSARKPCPTKYVRNFLTDTVCTNISFWISSKGLHNFAHPRTDPVVIMLAIDESGDKILLGRNVRCAGCFPVTTSMTNLRWRLEKVSDKILFGPCWFHGARRGVRRCSETRDVGRSRCQSLERPISFRAALGSLV